MNETPELERQQLIEQCHRLITAIASRPGSTKLLRGALKSLEIYAAYKTGRKRTNE